MLQRLSTLSTLVAALVAVSTSSAVAQVQQQSAKRLELSTASTEARAAFATALDYNSNLFPLRARENAAKAIAADPALGVARALLAASSPAMPAAERAAEFDRGVADAARASVGEMLFAAVLRANTLGRTAEAHALATAAATILPDDPGVAFFQAATAPSAEQQGKIRDVTRRFPEFAPAYNLLAYQLSAAGDQNGALQTIQIYMRLAPGQPNAHDSFAEMLQFAGRYGDAIAHYGAAARIDSAFEQAYAGMAEAHLLMGHGEVARATYAMAIERAPTPAAMINAQAARALSLVLDGKSRDALRELATVAGTAEQQSLIPQATAVYRAMALLEGAFGDRTAAVNDLSRAATLGGADVPAQQRITAIVAALVGDVPAAKASAARFRTTAATGTLAQQNQSHEVDAIIAVAERNLTLAQSELAKAGPTPNLGRAMTALALKKDGRGADADALKAAILGTGTVTAFDLVARAKVAKM